LLDFLCELYYDVRIHEHQFFPRSSKQVATYTRTLSTADYKLSCSSRQNINLKAQQKVL